MPENKVWYLGVYPGSAKTGFAWVEADGRIKKVAVLATETLPEVLPQILGSAPAAVILGNGTNCESIKKMLMEVTTVIKILMIEEGYSTEEARKLYWQENPPQGWRRLLPLGLQVPPVNLDGYAAAVLVRRYLKKINTV